VLERLEYYGPIEIDDNSIHLNQPEHPERKAETIVGKRVERPSTRTKRRLDLR
jgi:hypothetical protein